ncbi:alanine:cation symporter family protein, partial [Planococcus sp. SIMBA_143]
TAYLITSTTVTPIVGKLSDLYGRRLLYLIGVIIFGGVKRIAGVASYVVPFMAVAYILLSLIIVGMNIAEIPAVFALIFKSAFGADSIFGG